jgi:hypothetical protein
LYSQTFRTPLLEIEKPVPQNHQPQILKQQDYGAVTVHLAMCKFPKPCGCFCCYQSTLCAVKQLVFKVQKQFQEGKEDKKEERKKRRKKNFKFKCHIC